MAADSTEGSLKQRGVRLTRQRQILLELIDRTGAHLDVEQLYRMAKERDPKINRVTVYRTLNMLKAGGLVDELDLMHYGGDQHYYETRLKQEQAHVICLRCGRVEEFFGEPLQRLRKQIEAHFGFQILLARTEVGGYCSHCQVLRTHEVTQAAGENLPDTGRSARRRSDFGSFGFSSRIFRPDLSGFGRAPIGFFTAATDPPRFRRTRRPARRDHRRRPQRGRAAFRAAPAETLRAREMFPRKEAPSRRRRGTPSSAPWTSRPSSRPSDRTGRGRGAPASPPSNLAPRRAAP